MKKFTRSEVDPYARKIWDYMIMHQDIQPADAIVVLGSNDTRVAERAAELYRDEMAPVVIFTGGNGKISILEKTEAETFADVAEKHGVPRDVMYLEKDSTNTGANILNTKELVERESLGVKSIIVVTKPYMERRAYATVRKQWPDVQVQVTSQDISFDDYASKMHEPMKDPHFGFIRTMVGDMERIREYPKHGFQIEQEIPDDVWEAWEKLHEMGFDLHKL